MSQSPSPQGWPTWLLVLIAVGPPATALVSLLPTITRNPVLAAALLLTYWLLLGLSVYLKKVWEKRGDDWAEAGAGTWRRCSVSSLLMPIIGITAISAMSIVI